MDLNDLCNKLIKYDRHIQAEEEKLKQYKDRRSHYQNLIMQKMKEQNISQRKINDYDFKLNQTNQKTTITQKYLKDTIHNYFIHHLDTNLSEEQRKRLSQNLYEFLLNSRKNETKIQLKY